MAELRRAGQLERVEEIGTLTEILAYPVAAPNARYACERLIMLERARETRRACLAAADRLGQAPEQLEEIVASLGLDTRAPATAAVVEYLTVDLEGVVEPLPWLVPSVIVERDLGNLVGIPGEGKSTTGIAIAVGLASGRPAFAGALPPTRTAPVVYFDAEMGPLSTRRLFKRIIRGMALEAQPEPLLVVSAPGISRSCRPMGASGSKRRSPHGPSATNPWERRSSSSTPCPRSRPDGVIQRRRADRAGLCELFRWRDALGATFVLLHHPRSAAAGKPDRPSWTCAGQLDRCRQSLGGPVTRKPARDATCLDVYTLKHRDRDPIPVQRVGYLSEGPMARSGSCSRSCPHRRPRGKASALKTYSPTSSDKRDRTAPEPRTRSPSGSPRASTRRQSSAPWCTWWPSAS